ncbi:MAG: sulfate ABC transporter permease subunit CysW [Spartobacteria bacterium]
MAGASQINLSKKIPRRATGDHPLVRAVLIGATLAFFALFLALPLWVVFQEAFSKGIAFFLESFGDRYTLHSIGLTLLVAVIAVPLNTLFGVMAAWAITRYKFPGRPLLTTLIELPLWVSPVIGGLVYVLVFGAQGWLGPWLRENEIRIIFAVPGIVLATTFVTFPFVARSLIPLMQAQGSREEEAAMTLGANGWQIFRRVTLPKIQWGLFYGVILCNARAMGEFGAVSVVSGHIRGKTNTIPLQIEILYNEYQFAAAFALASLLSILALVTLVLKTYSEWRAEQQLRETASHHAP